MPAALIYITISKKMTNNYRIADIVISIDSIYSEVHDLCRDYLEVNDAPDIYIHITESDIDKERKLIRRIQDNRGLSAEANSFGYIETLAVLRKISETMPYHDTILFHGSCVAVDGEGYVFSAPSGTGKSTHTGNWRKRFGDRAVMVNDDKPFIKITDNKVVVYGSPWNGKHRLGNNISAPLKALCIIERADKNMIISLSAEDAYPMILRQTYIPQDAGGVKQTLELVDRLISKVSLWRLSCNRDIESAEIAYKAMKG